MLSRLIVLAIMRKLAMQAEEQGVDQQVVREWCSEVTETVCQPAASTQAARVIEDRLIVLTGLMLDHMWDATGNLDGR